MFSYARVEIMGVVPEAPAILSRRNGGLFVKFAVGTKNGQGEIYYHPVVARDALAESVRRHVHEGSTVVAHGYISNFSYVKNGEEFSTQEIVLTDCVAFTRHEQSCYLPPQVEDATDDELT